jgi:hypothetical protein
MNETNAESSWCVVAKIRESTPYGQDSKETKIGSKHFKPGAKVYIVDWYPGMCTTVTVVGHHRKSNRLITIDINIKYLSDLQIKVVYKPYVLEKIEDKKILGCSSLNENQAEEIKAIVAAWIDEEAK